MDHTWRVAAPSGTKASDTGAHRLEHHRHREIGVRERIELIKWLSRRGLLRDVSERPHVTSVTADDAATDLNDCILHISRGDCARADGRGPTARTRSQVGLVTDLRRNDARHEVLTSALARRFTHEEAAARAGTLVVPDAKLKRPRPK